MDSILMFIIVVTVIYFFITWALPKVLSWMFTLKYKFKVTIGQVKFPKLKLKNILITKNGFSVHIEEIGISSNLFNSEVTKLIAITIHDVRINKIRPVSEVSEIATINNDDIFENIKLPSSIITLGQFLFIQLVNISAVWAGKSGWLIQATASEIKLEGGSVSPQGTRAVVLSITVHQANMRLRRRAAPDHIDLVELAHDMNANVTLTSRWPPEKLHIAVHRPRCIVNEELLEYIQNNPHIESHTRFESRPFPKYVVPKNCTISIDDVSIQSILAGRNDLNVSLKSFEMNSRCNGMFETPADLLLYFALQLDSFRMDSCRQSIFALNKLSLDAKVQSKVINLYVFLHTLKIVFDKSLWPSLPQNGTVQTPRDSSKTKSTFLTDWTIQACGELWAACSTFTNGTSLRCYHTKLMVEHAASMFSVELLLEIFCWAATTAIDFTDARRCHLTGTIVFLSVALLKLSHSPQYARLDAMLDVFRIEWSSVLRYFLHNTIFTNSSHARRSNHSLILIPEIWTINIALSNVNLFFIEEESVYIATRLDSVTVEGCETKSSIEFSGCKLVDLDTNTQMFMCTRSEEMTKTSCSVKSCRFDRTCRLNTNFEWSIDIANRLDLKWNPVFHLKMVTIIRSFIKSDNSQSQQVSHSVQNKWSIRIARLCFIGHTGNHELRLDVINGLIKGPSLRIKAVTCCFTFDNASVITAQSLNLQKLISHPELKEERLAADGFVKADNEAWLFSLAVFEARFPYKHSFADAVQNELVTIVKWLKKIHNKQKVQFTLDSPLPRDLLIKINDCLFEMADDPFEVRLRDNYELLQDEYNESLKRQQMLDSRLTELLRTHLLLPAGKVEELYANLSKKNGEIYIQRSKQISLAGPARTRLLAWHSVGVSIAALADLSLHGTERVLNFIRGVDPASPWPADGLACTTLWTRQISVSIEHSTVSLRDFPQPFVEARRLRMWGRLAGAEQIPPPRSVRNVTLDFPPPWEPTTIERGMTQLKFYHDINLEMDHYSYAFGPCWEPVIAQCNLSMEQIIAPSRDPSPPLPFWDKMRLLLHGRLTMLTHHMTVLLHASLDPYNTTEEMELAWHDMVLDWTNAKIVIKGDLDVYVRTASKYDDCQLLHLPNIKLVIKLDWVCLADANDHHSVVPCAPDRVPEYSSNNQHDSYRAFRSQHIDASVSLDARGRSLGEGVLDGPTLLLYGSTLRWFESLQLILSGVTRPTRRGLLFGPKRPRRIPLSRMPLELIDFVYRHYRTVRLLFTLQHFQASYWMSCAMQRGCELLGIRAVCGSEHTLTLVPTADGLLRRPRAAWSVGYMNCELTDAEVWLKSALRSDTRVDTPESSSSSDDESPLPVEKCYFLSVAKVSYGRETPVLADNKDTPTHKLVVYDLKGAWTKRNRDVAFALFDAFVKSQQLKKNLSAEALRLVDAAAGTENSSTDTDLETEPTSPPEEAGGSHQLSAASMLRQLIAEAEHKNVVFSDDQSPAGRQPQLRGLQACQQDDVLHKNWSIALVNSQVVLRGCETKGYVILSAAKAEILQRVHGPAIPKRTWVGSLECLQYYATVCPADEDIMWLPVEHIQERARSGESTTGPAAVVGSGRAAGGVVSEVVGAAGRQLQRIVSRCRCEFFYVSYGSGDSASSGAPQSDAFTLMHHDLDVCTNSLQYGVLLDVINSLILWVEPARKEAAARLARLRFQLQLQSDGGVRVPVQKLQTQVRTLLGALRRLERDAHLAGASPAGQRLRAQLLELKQELGARAEELQMLLAIHRGSAPHSTMRTSEICFKHAQWRLTDADGQLGIADLVLSNFLYTKKSKSDDSVEHLLELGYVHMTNLLPNQVYTEVLSPTEIQRDMPVDHKHVLRVFCRERPPVGGISVKEHFEINVVPITIGLTKKFYNTMLKFCFPERDDPDAMQSKVSKDTSFYVRIDRKDDVEKMKERAEKNKLFIYIKIPEVPVRVSYKGNKDKNIEDVRDFSLVIPTLEYHNVTWTWLDLLLAMKSDTRRVILSQAIKQKLQLHRGGRSSSQVGAPCDGPGMPQEEDKARMLLGKRPLPQTK